MNKIYIVVDNMGVEMIMSTAPEDIEIYIEEYDHEAAYEKRLMFTEKFYVALWDDELFDEQVRKVKLQCKQRKEAGKRLRVEAQRVQHHSHQFLGRRKV